MITDPETYFARGCARCARFDTPDCSTKRWAEGLAALRGLCLAAGLEETAKWGHPCYMHAGRNIAIIGAFRDDFRLNFMDAALLSDPEGALVRQGPNSGVASALRFSRNSGPGEMAGLIGRYLAEAMDHAVAGTRAPKPPREIVLPEELTDALAGDAELDAAFAALTPGRQRSYVIGLSGAKKPETRRRRIEGWRGRILAGKGATER